MKWLVMHEENDGEDTSSIIMLTSSSASCMGQILKFGIDVTGDNPCFVSSNLTS